ncbi:CHASE2 domain-containing protein, partial [bacterium]|nr:CHASE2 domain-containing protein [bacterium]
DAHFGFNNLFPDNDNVLRQSPLIYSSGKSLALKAYEFLKGFAPPVDLTQPIHIFFRGPAGTFPSLDAWDVFENTTDLALIRDQVVLIGREGSPSHDVETPFGKMSRLEVQGNIVRTFLESKQIQILSSPIQLLASFLTVVGAIGIILYFPLSVAWLLLMLFASSLVMLSYMSLIWFKAWWGLANPLFCILGTHLLLIGFKIGRQEEKQWRIQEESRYLKEMDEFKNNFVSLFSHDLKTPIAKIKAILDRLQSENPSLDPSVRQGLSGVERANNELARLISDILRITKMESMPIEPAKEVVDINRLVESAIQRLSFLFEEKEIKLVANLEPLFAMEGDPQLLLEVITNLLENAVKYSPSKSQVVIQTQETDHQVRVSVRDEGPGIPEEELPRVTSKFYRGKSVDKSTRGSGLGLYLAKYFVELHRGTLHLTSEPGRGTEVSFTLPIR